MHKLLNNITINLPHGYHVVLPKWLILIWIIYAAINLILDIATAILNRKNKKLLQELEQAEKDYEKALELKRYLGGM